MGQKNNHAYVPATSKPDKNRDPCCQGCSCATWVLYFVTFVSMAVSVIVLCVFMLKTQEVDKKLAKFSSERNLTIQRLVESHIGQLKSLARKNERISAKHEAQIGELRREAVGEVYEDDFNDVNSEKLEMMMNQMRTTHGTIINQLNSKLTSWESANAATLKTLNRLKTTLSDLETARRSHLNSINNLKNGVEKLWRAVEAQGESIEYLQGDTQTAQKAREAIVEQLLEEESSSEERHVELARSLAEVRTETSGFPEVISRLQNDLSELRNRSGNLEDDVGGLQVRIGVALQNLEEKWGNSSEKFKEDFVLFNVSLRQKMEEAITNFIDNHLEKHHPPESTTEIALASKTDLADLRRDLHDLADLATDLANDHNLTLSRLDSLEGRLDPEMATTVRNNTDRLDDMDDKVGHFIRSLLKVKKLPSEVVALEDRIVTLDDNLAKMAAILAEVKKGEENE